MFDEKIKELQATIANLNARIASKTSEVKAALNADDLDKARAIKAEIENAKADLVSAKADLKLFEDTMNAGGAEKKAGQKVEPEEMSYRD